MSAPTKPFDLRAERRGMIDRWFKNHRASLDVHRTGAGRSIERLVWGHPETSVHAIVYVADHNRLLVYGDLYDAVYCVGSPATLAWWASCDLSYFAGKCMASEHGRGYKDWDEREARRRAIEHFDTHAKSAAEYFDDAHVARYATRRAAFDDHDGTASLASESEWVRWLERHGVEAFGDDYWEFAELGKVVDQFCEGHLIGLKRAITQLRESGELRG